MVTRFITLALCALAVGVAGCEGPAPTEAPLTAPSGAYVQRAVLPGRYIVVLNESVSPSAVRAVADQLASASGGRVRQYYRRALVGFAIETSAASAAAIARDPRVRRVDQDVQIAVKPKAGRVVGRNKAQVTSWGTTRVGGSHDGTGRRCWIIDSGIDPEHPDLRVDLTHAATFVPGTTSTEDQNGHGTHVAGIVGALDNAIGSLGVAAGATLIPVRVLDRRGQGEASWAIAGIEHVLANAAIGDVANMSFGTGLVPALDDAVVRLATAGVRIAIAAGNDGANCAFISPARVNHPNVYTVSAFEQGDLFASFSNYGAGIVDYAAPGVEIISAKKGGGVTSMSGTSMAAPHVAGLLVAGSLRSGGTVSGDNDGEPDPIAVY